jgi:hypothetical protein
MRADELHPIFCRTGRLMISLYPAAADPNVYKAYIVTRLFKGKHTAVESATLIQTRCCRKNHLPSRNIWSLELLYLSRLKELLKG